MRGRAGNNLKLSCLGVCCPLACHLLFVTFCLRPTAGGFKPVEAKYPALLFKQQLDAFVQKIFPMMRDNVKKQITPMLANCIMTPKAVLRSRAGHTDQSEWVWLGLLCRMHP